MSSTLVTEVLERLAGEGRWVASFAGKRILVTGGAGFIGSWLVEGLARLGADVYVVDNLWRGSLDHLRKADGEPWIDLERQFLLGDLTDPVVVTRAVEWSEPDWIYHLADVVAGVDFVFSNEPFVFHTNVLINTNVFHAARQARVAALAYVGTACSYPRQLQQQPGAVPLVEEQVLPADPESAYGWSKLMGEYEAEMLSMDSSSRVGILRLQNVYGPRASLSRRRSQVIPSLIRKAILHPEEEFVVWGSGAQTRDFVYVGDVIDALLRLPLLGLDEGPIQIGTAQETTIAELARRIVAISGRDISVRFDESRPVGDAARSGDFQKARRILGWKVHTSLDEGLRETYRWAEGLIAQDKGSIA